MLNSICLPTDNDTDYISGTQIGIERNSWRITKNLERKFVATFFFKRGQILLKNYFNGEKCIYFLNYPWIVKQFLNWRGIMDTSCPYNTFPGHNIQHWRVAKTMNMKLGSPSKEDIDYFLLMSIDKYLGLPFPMFETNPSNV